MSLGLGLGLGIHTGRWNDGRVLDLDLVNSRGPAPLGTYTRSTPAMQFDSSGVLGWGAHNFLTYSEQFNNAAWTKVRTTVSADATTAPDGTATADALYETAVTNTFHVDYSYTPLAGTTYIPSVYVKANGRGYATVDFSMGGTLTSATVNLSTGAVSAGAAVVSNAGNGWWRVAPSSGTTATTVAGSVRVWISNDGTAQPSYAGDITKGIYVWGAQLNYGTTALTYVPTTSAAVTNLPRPDYDPATLSKRGWLMEGSRQNLLLYSEDFRNTATAGSSRPTVYARASVTADAIAAPDGVSSADAIVEDGTAGNTHYVYQDIAKAASAIAYTWSVYVKAGTRTQVRLVSQDSGASGRASVLFNLSDGSTVTAAATVGTFSASSASCVAQGNGWYRCSLSFTTGTEVTLRSEVRLCSGGTDTYNGDGASLLYAWGAQLEAATFPSSYIPTTTGSASRSADLWTISNAQFLAATGQNIPQAEGTLFLEALGANEVGNYNRFIGIGPSSGALNQNSVNVFWYGGTPAIGANVYAGGVSQLDLSRASARGNPTFKIAIGWGATHRAYLNGTDLGAPSGTTAISTGLEEIRIGSGNGAYPHAWIRRVIIYPRRLTNAELASITA